MALILSIETATEICSVALAENGNLLTLMESKEGRHSELLTVMIEEIVNENKFSFNDLDAVAISKGPGSYTGLRIGASVAKGLCYALDKPLIAVSTLKSLANNFLRSDSSAQFPSPFFLCPMIDARRMEVYCALFDEQLNEVSPVEAHILTNESFKSKLLNNKIIFFGNGAEKCKPFFENNTNAIVAETAISVAGMITLAEEKFRIKKLEDIALFEPFYLKEAAIGRKKSE